MTPCPIDGHRRICGGNGWKLAVVCAVASCRCLECNQLARTEEDSDAS